MGAAPVSRRFRVRIYYREPTYELRSGAKRAPYQFTFEVDAGTEDGAVEMAVRQFRETAQLSSVSWTREIVSTEVEAASGSDGVGLR